MTRFLSAVAGVLVCAAAAAAQTPPAPRPAPAPSPGMTAQSDPATLTVTGCLKAWDASVAPSDPALAGAAAGRFLLTNIQPAAPGTAEPGKVRPAAPPANTQYVVTSAPSVDLAAHVNHTVRIEGTVAVSDAAANPAHGHTGRSASKADRWAGLTATSLTMVSPACTGATE